MRWVVGWRNRRGVADAWVADAWVGWWGEEPAEGCLGGVTLEG